MKHATPFYSAPKRFGTTGRRLLLLSYHFPPGREAGALRWQKLARHAADYGWEVDAVTVHPASLAHKEDSRLRELPAGTRVFGVTHESLMIDRIEQSLWNRYSRMKRRWQNPGASDPGGAREERQRPQSMSREEARRLELRPRDLIRAYYALLLFLRHKRWARAAAAVAREVFQPGSHRAVVTCGPPHGIHVFGRELARRLGVPFIMDMRDPWSLVERLPEVVASPMWWYLARRGERRAVMGADLIVCNTEPARRALQSLYPPAARRCISVMNGYDDDPLPETRDDGRFAIAYAGTIYLDRNPRILLRAAARVIRDLRLPPDRFALEFMGHVQSYDGIGLPEMAEQEGIEAYVHVRPHGTREDAMRFLARAAMLVSLPQDSHMAIPSKVFEYMRFDAWTLALAKRGSATEEVLREVDGAVADPDDVDAITQIIRNRYESYLEHGRPNRPALVPQCSRAEQARRLFDAIAAVTKSDPSEGHAPSPDRFAVHP